MSARKDLTGLQFGDYTVLELDSIRDKERAVWLIECKTCKFTKKSTGSNLLNGKTDKCQICRANKKSGLTMEQINEIKVLYFDDSITKQEIADKYNVPRHIIYGLKIRFEWGNSKKKPLKRKRQFRPKPPKTHNKIKKQGK